MDIYTSSILISIVIYALVGNYAGRKVKHLEDYFVVGRQSADAADRRHARGQCAQHQRLPG